MNKLSEYNIGIIAAMENEFNIIYENMKSTESEKVFDTKYYIGRINNIDVVLVKSGIGKVNAASATTTLIDHFGCNLIINSGIAGGIKPVKTRDLVIASSLVYNDFDITNFGYEYGQVPGMPKLFLANPNLLICFKQLLNKLNIKYLEGIIASGDKFARSMDIIKDNKGLNILAVDMESAAVAQVATKAGVDFMIIRFISDIIGEESQIEFYDKFEEEMASSSAKITLSLIESLEI